MFEFEQGKLQSGYTHIIGVDEVGRGSLAGPVVAGAVAFNFETPKWQYEPWVKAVNDSKLLQSAKRLSLDLNIRGSGQAFGFGVVSHRQIDRINIHNASLLAMHIAVQEVLKKLSNNSKIFLAIDGRFQLPELHIKQEAVVDGDAKVFSISAASIVAKVYRDNLMMKLDSKFPEYGFAQHKGYGTKQHCAAIRRYGLSAQHRKTFCKKLM